MGTGTGFTIAQLSLLVNASIGIWAFHVPKPGTPQAGAGHFGMIFVPGSYRRTKADTGRIIAALEEILNRCPGEKDLANGEALL